MPPFNRQYYKVSNFGDGAQQAVHTSCARGGSTSTSSSLSGSPAPQHTAALHLMTFPAVSDMIRVTWAMAWGLGVHRYHEISREVGPTPNGIIFILNVLPERLLQACKYLSFIRTIVIPWLFQKFLKFPINDADRPPQRFAHATSALNRRQPASPPPTRSTFSTPAKRTSPTPDSPPSSSILVLPPRRRR